MIRELHLFAGAGGGILGGVLCGHVPVCAVELEEYPRRVLLQRQRDGILPWFPVWDDVRTFNGRPWRGRVDLIAGGFPCQDISSAGRGAGINGEHSGLWSEFARIIGEVRPRFVLVENSPLLTVRGLGRVLGDLAALGFDAEWGVLGADDAGAPHIRKRIWILGSNTQCLGSHHAQDIRLMEGQGARELCAIESRDSGEVAHAAGLRWRERRTEPAGREGGPSAFIGCSPLAEPCSSGLEEWEGQEGGATRQLRESLSDPSCDRHRQGGEVGDLRQEDGGSRGALLPEPSEPSWWAAEPRLGRVAHGVAHRVDRLRAIGNGQVPAVARLAWEVLK